MADETNDLKDEGPEETPDAPLDEQGLRALRRANEEAKTYRLKLKEAAEELERFRQDAMSESERALEQARREAADAARSEERGRLLGQLVESQVVAAAAGKLANPQLAARLLDLSSFATEDGSVNTGAIVEAIDRLVVDEPYLKASAMRPVSADQGIRGAAAGSTSQSDMNSLIRQAAGR
jgi:hypothetical protein